MPKSLPLALDIADSLGAARSLEESDAFEIARQLVESHPEAEVTAGEVFEMLQEEALGLSPASPGTPDV